MSIMQMAIYGLVGFGMSVLSGITGGGGGFVMTPLLVIMGLSPAQAVSTTKIGGLSLTLGALGGLGDQHSRLSRVKVGAVMVLALVIGALAPLAIRSLESQTYRIILGVILLGMVPIMIVKRIGLQRSHPSGPQQAAGWGLLSLALALQAVFSGGLGALVNVVLMSMLGMSATEANLTKRYSQLILNVAVIIGVLGSGLIVWQIVPVILVTTTLGGFIGGRLAVKRGNRFVMNVMMILMVISGLALIAGVGM